MKRVAKHDGIREVPNMRKCHRHLRPHISSTFYDVKEEFKYLHMHTFPKLDKVCQKRGIRFKPADFCRTAVDSRLSSQWAFKHALDSIVECSPYFMAVFGQQYGSHRIPGEPLLNREMDLIELPQLSRHDRNFLIAGNNGYPWVLEKENQFCSCLELEIQIAALGNNNTAKHCLFYVRDIKQLYLKQKSNGSEALKMVPASSHIEESDDLRHLLGNESEYAKNKLNSLKIRIAEKGWKIRYFSTMEELGAAVLDDWSQLIYELFPVVPQVTEFTSQLWSGQAMVEGLCARYCWNSELMGLIKAIDEHVLTRNCEDSCEVNAPILNTEDEAYIRAPQHADGLFSTTRSLMRNTSAHLTANDHKSILVLVGDPGIGKSAIIAQWLQHFQTYQPSILVISEFIGSSHISRDIGSFLRRCLKTIRELYNQKGMTCSELLEDAKSYSELVSAFEECIKSFPCVLVIDSLNDLKAGMNEDIGSIKRLTWLPDTIPSHCRIIMTTRRSDLTHKALEERKDVDLLHIPPLSDKHKVEVLLAYLRLPSDVGHQNLAKIVGHRLSEKPLYLSVLADLVNSCNSREEIDQVMERCTESRTFRDFWKTVFNLWTRRFSWTKRSAGQPGSCGTSSTATGWVAEVLRLVASARNGLLESEIQHLLFLLGYRRRAIVTPYDWMMFQKSAGTAFSLSPDGYVKFSHTEIRHAVKFYLLGAILPTATGSAASLGPVNLQQHYHSLLASYFLKYGSMERKLIELPWQLEQASDWIMLCQVLTKPRFFQCFWEHMHVDPYLLTEHARYWTKLKQAGYYVCHCLQVMMDKCISMCDASYVPRSIPSREILSQNRRSSGICEPKSLPGSSTSKIHSATLLKKPAVVVTLYDDYRRQSTVGSISETIDLDMTSEEGGYTFFLTETAVEDGFSGWTPSQDDPDQSIDESKLNDDEVAELGYNVLALQLKLPEKVTRESKDGLFSLYQHLLALKPLSTRQNIVLFKTLSEIARLPSDDSQNQLIYCICKEALSIHRSLDQNLVPTLRPPQVPLSEFQVSICLCLAELYIDDRLYKKAESMLKFATETAANCQSTTQDSDVAVTCGKLFMMQGLHGYAEAIFATVFTKRLKWYGPKHVRVAEVLSELGDLYALTIAKFMKSRRMSSLAYKQALTIFQHNSVMTKIVDTLYKIGILLSGEESHCSLQEAKESFQQAIDAYMSLSGSTQSNIPYICSALKKLLVDLQTGFYGYGAPKPSDAQSEERPYIAVFRHDGDLKKILKRPSTVPLYYEDKPILKQKLYEMKNTMAAHCKFDTSTFANHILVTPREHNSVSTTRLKMMKNTSSLLSSKPLSLASAEAYSPDNLKGTGLFPDRLLTSSVKSDGLVARLDDEGLFKARRYGHNEPKNDRPFSRISRKLDIDDKSVKSLPTQPSLPETTVSSSWMRPKSRFVSVQRPLSVRSAPVPKHLIHQRCCQVFAGPDNISLSVHGSYSSLDAVLPPQESPRPNVLSSGICHKSAWYNIPGHYTTSPRVLSPKPGRVSH